MNSIQPQEESFLDVVSIGAALSRLKRTIGTDSDGITSDYWNANELAPESARRLCAAVADTLRLRFTLSPGSTRMVVRTRDSRRLSGHLDADVVLQYRPAPHDASICLLRRTADVLMRGLQPPPSSVGGSPAEPSSGTALSAEVLLSTPLSAFLGIKLERELVARIPDHSALRLSGRLTRAVRTALQHETLVVCGQVVAMKLSGRCRSAALVGHLEESRTHEFSQAKVAFSEDLRPVLAAAMAEPGSRLRLVVEKTSVPTGKAVPKVSYELKGANVVLKEGSAQ